jgi:hypothetical protein
VMPTQQQLLRPFLEVLVDGATRSLADVEVAIVDGLQLGEEERAAKTSSGGGALANRVGWTRTALVKAGLIDQPGPSEVVITDAGRALLDSHVGALDFDVLREISTTFAFWLADMGQVADATVTADDGAGVWMLRAGRGGMFAAAFVERSLAIVGWGALGDVGEMSLEDLGKAYAAHWPNETATKRGQAVNTLHRLVHTIADGDLIITPEPASRTLLLGRVAGPYQYLKDPPQEDYRSARPVTWFARVSRDELSYGARNSLGALMTLSRPSHAAELRQLADLHAHDPSPKPLESAQTAAAPAAPAKVPIPASATVATRTTVAEFQTNPMALLPLLDQLEQGQIALPDFQRTFVWQPDETRELIVSIIRSFPAGALLFLQGGSATFKARVVEAAPEMALTPSYLVLDGQQRLTSLFQAFSGVGPSRFFLDVGGLLAGSEVNDCVTVMPAEKAGVLESRQAQAAALVMPLAVVRRGGIARWRDEVIALRDAEERHQLRDLLYGIEDAFITPMVQYRFPVTVLPDSTELEAVCTIFETLNRTGKPLTPFELISARAFADGLSLFDYWTAARDEHPILDDFEIAPYYLLQVIALRLGGSAKRSSILTLGADQISKHWHDVVADMAAAIRLLRDECGVLVSNWLPYRPMLIPLATAWRQVAQAGGPEQGTMRTKLKQWFWCACFAGEYESSSSSLIERDGPALREWLTGGSAPPVTALAWEPQMWRTVTRRQQGLYRATMALTLTSNPRDFHSAAPLTREVIQLGKVDDHHVFPGGYLKDIGRAGEPDSILNHTLIDRATNQSIGKKAPSVYMQIVRDALGNELDAVLASHRLPTGPTSSLATNDFDAFLSWRLQQLTDALKQRVGQLATPARTLDPQLAALSTRIETVELDLRDLISAQLNNNPAALPPHLLQKARERADANTRREPGGQAEGGIDLGAVLEFLDLRELQDVICAKACWAQFAEVFVVKETLNTRFTQLAELRNAIRHSRKVSDIAVMDGEASLMWFEQALTEVMTSPAGGAAEATANATSTVP